MNLWHTINRAVSQGLFLSSAVGDWWVASKMAVRTVLKLFKTLKFLKQQPKLIGSL